MFKLIGAALGYWAWGFWGLLLGLLVGAIIDRIRRYSVNAIRQLVFLETLFTLMGRMAKIDGQISQHEIDHVEQFMKKLGMTDTHRQQAINLFKQGADPSFNIDPICQKFVKICGHSKNLKQVLLVYLIVLAHSDGVIHQAEQTLLDEIASKLGYAADEFKLLINMVKNQTHFNQPDPAVALDDAYKALGMTKENSDAEIKRAYRKLMSQYHPDKLIGQGMPADMVAIATEQAKEIQLAYDLIKQNRNIS